jgi:hypothetical protein
MISELKSIYHEKEWARQKLSQLADDFTGLNTGENNNNESFYGILDNSFGKGS